VGLSLTFIVKKVGNIPKLINIDTGSSFFHRRDGYWIILVLANKNNLCCTILRVFSLVNNLTLGVMRD
jgi:hypothetical protein